MKTSLKWILCLGACIATSTTFSQPYNYGTPASATNDTNRVSSSSKASEDGQSQTFCSSKDLVGAAVKDSAGNKLGDIHELYVNPKNGETFASLGVSGGRYALLPLQALTVTRPGGMIRNAELSLNTTKQALESGPTVAKNEWNRLDNPSFIQSIYSHYNVQQPSATGGVSDRSLGGTSSGESQSNTNQLMKPQP
jgi:hypothetical protein